jgi:serine/threonine protein kinase
VPDPLARLKAALPDRYRVERLFAIGEVGGAVYLARDLTTDRKVALRVLPASVAAELGAERFLRETMRTAPLQHPGILNVLDCGDAAGQLWLVLPFVAGESLRERLEREKQLPLDDALRIAHDVALALEYVHRHGVTPVGVEPSRIWLAADGRTLARCRPSRRNEEVSGAALGEALEAFRALSSSHECPATTMPIGEACRNGARMNRRTLVLGMALAAGGVFSAGCSGSTSPSPPLPPPPPPEQEPPAAPANLVATPLSPSEITLTWQDNSNNEDAFVIQRCAADWGPEQGCPREDFRDFARVATNVTAHTDQGLTAADSYSYRVYALNAKGKSEYSNVATATASVSGPPPAAPTALEAGVPFKSLWLCDESYCYYTWEYDLWWQDNSDNEDGFLLELCAGAGCTAFTRYDTAPANATDYHISAPAVFCVVWNWRVRAHNGGGYSGYSNSVVVTPPECQVKSSAGVD